MQFRWFNTTYIYERMSRNYFFCKIPLWFCDTGGVGGARGIMMLYDWGWGSRRPPNSMTQQTNSPLLGHLHFWGFHNFWVHLYFWGGLVVQKATTNFVVIVDVVAVDPRNLPLNFGQNGVSNSWYIADIEFLCFVFLFSSQMALSRIYKSVFYIIPFPITPVPPPKVLVQCRVHRVDQLTPTSKH